MSIDDVIDFDVYDEHLFDSPKLKRYNRYDLVGKINDIASFSFGLSQDVIDFLHDAEEGLGVRAIESICKYITGNVEDKYGIIRSHRIISIASSKDELSTKGVEAVLDELDAFDECVQKGTVNKWAKTIIQYFMEHSKCAGHYSNLVEQDRALTAV